MKNRKLSLSQQMESAKIRLMDEIKTENIFLDAAERKVDALIAKIKEGDASPEVQKELETQTENVQHIKEKLEKYQSQLKQLKSA